MSNIASHDDRSAAQGEERRLRRIADNRPYGRAIYGAQQLVGAHDPISYSINELCKVCGGPRNRLTNRRVGLAAPPSAAAAPIVALAIA